MDTSKAQEESQTRTPLLQNPTETPTKTPTQIALKKTFKGTAHLAKLLPTGSVLTFQILSPIITHDGQCNTITSKSLTQALLSVCAFSCFILCFTDSFRDEKGKVCYGFATFSGLWVIDGLHAKLTRDQEVKYRLRAIDFVHAFMSVLVFGTIALFNKNVVKCFWARPSDEVKDLLVVVPFGVGFICSIFFLIFPTKRHGIGCPLSCR